MRRRRIVPRGERHLHLQSRDHWSRAVRPIPSIVPVPSLNDAATGRGFTRRSPAPPVALHGSTRIPGSRPPRLPGAARADRIRTWDSDRA